MKGEKMTNKQEILGLLKEPRLTESGNTVYSDDRWVYLLVDGKRKLFALTEMSTNRMDVEDVDRVIAANAKEAE